MPTTPLDALGASAARLATLVEPLTPDDLRRSAYPTEWRIADVLSHLGSGAVDVDVAAAECGIESECLTFHSSQTGCMRVGLRLNEHALHSWDIAAVLDPTATVPDDAASLVVDSLGLIAGFAAKPTGADRTITIRTTTPTRGFEITMRPDGVTFSPTAADDADAADAIDLKLPAEALIRLVYGRLDPTHTPPVDGSPADLEELRRTFPGI